MTTTGTVNVATIEHVETEREAMINDYMGQCGYTREEAINAYNNVLRHEG